MNLPIVSQIVGSSYLINLLGVGGKMVGLGLKKDQYPLDLGVVVGVPLHWSIIM